MKQFQEMLLSKPLGYIRQAFGLYWMSLWVILDKLLCYIRQAFGLC